MVIMLTMSSKDPSSSKIKAGPPAKGGFGSGIIEKVSMGANVPKMSPYMRKRLAAAAEELAQAARERGIKDEPTVEELAELAKLANTPKP